MVYKTYCLRARYLQSMFVQELNSLSQDYPSGQSITPIDLQSNALEFQYQLCQIFLKKTGEQLHSKESHLMLESQELLKRISARDCDKGCCSTDQGSDEVSSSLHEDENSGSFTHSRRSEGGAWRKIENKLGVWLNEIEEKCSALCLVNLKAVITDYRRLLERCWQVEAREGALERKNAQFQRQHQENLLLKQKLDTQAIKIESLNCEIECLKQKNQTIIDYANQRLQQMLGQQKVVEINGKVFKDVKNYLEDKERSILNRIARVEVLEQELLGKVTSLMPANSCENCCGMLRKLKDSLIRFKKHLEGEACELQALYQKYKKTLFSPRNTKTHL